ncbi:MAG TPA: AzlC family ABC transporter permease [Burkholderiaceae bacterium]|nr:AzlC family ABC transporter permease [Burkholderiaceae bacterium]
MRDATADPGDGAAERAALRAGVASVGATVVGTFAWGLVTGLALVKGGLSAAQALGMVMLVFSGTAQLAALPLIVAGASLPAIWATALLANLRFVVYSATVAVEFRGQPLGRRLALGWLTTDTGLAAYLASQHRGPAREPERARAARFAGANGTVYGGWTIGTAVGVGLAGAVPDSPRIGFVGVLAILALVGPMLTTRTAVGVAAAAAAVALPGVDWPWRLGTFGAIAAGVAVALPASRRAR